jgi:hypothetical protein
MQVLNTLSRGEFVMVTQREHFTFTGKLGMSRQTQSAITGKNNFWFDYDDRQTYQHGHATTNATYQLRKM